MPAVTRHKEDSDSSSEDGQEDHPCIAWSGLSGKIPVLLFHAEAIVSKDGNIRSIGERYNLSYKIVRTESRLVRGILTNHGFHEVHPNSNDFNLMWTGSHLKPYLLRSLQDFQKVNHFPRSYELTRKDRLYKNIQRMQQAHGFKNFHIVPQTFVLPSEYQEFCSSFSKDKGPWIIKPVASSRGRGIYLVSHPNQIPPDENILVSRYINNPLLIDDFKFDVRLYVLVTSYDPIAIYLYEEGLARFATVKYDRAAKNIKNQFMHLTNYSVNKKSSDYVSCDDPEVEDYGNKWSMSAMLRYLKQEGKDTTLLMSQVEELIIKAVLSAELQIATACKTFVPHRTNCFELYGFDVLIDANLKPWLLEVNLSPSLACDAPLDLKIKASVISDMFSLVGFVCQDPLLRQPRSQRVTLDPSSLKYPTQRSQRQRPQSASSADAAEATKDKPGAKQGDSTLGLTAEELKVLRRMKEEHERRGGFVRIFPTPESWELYGGYLEYKTSMNSMLANRLFHGRKVNGAVRLQVDAFHACHVFQYERKLLSLEVRKRRRRQLAGHSALRRRKAAKGRQASPTESGDKEDVQECEERVPGAEEEVEKKSQAAGATSPRAPPPPPPLTSAPADPPAADPPGRRLRNDGPPGPGRLAAAAKHKVDLLHILRRGWDLSKVQARVAFSSYLQRVQLRLLAESRTRASSAWPENDNDQMELVVRFLERAASNLQQDMKMVLPSPQLPALDRRRLLSHQLGEFIYCYNKETEQMAEEASGEAERCVDRGVFQEFIAEASESDLEEVLTFYTHKSKSASVFLGTKCRSAERERSGDKASGEPVKPQNQKTLPVAKEEVSSASESSLSAATVSTDPPSRTPASRSSAGAGEGQPEVRAGQHSTSAFPPALNSAHIQPKRPRPPPDSLPLHCPPPPPPSRPPSYVRSPPYAQSLSRSHLRPPSQPSAPPPPPPPPHPPQPPSSSAAPQPHRVIWASRPHPRPGPAQLLRRFQSFTSASSSSSSSTSNAAASSLPVAAHVYGQTLSRPTSAGQVTKTSGSSRSRPASGGGGGAFKDSADSLSVQARSNRQAIVSALQKLAERQAARQYTASSHISLLTQHLTNLNLANGVLGRASFTLGPAARHRAVAHGPVRAVHSDVDLDSNAGHSPRPQRDEEAPRDGETQSATYSPAAGFGPQRHHQPTAGSYQLRFAIQQLKQQKLQSRQLLDQSRTRHQALLAGQTVTPAPLSAARPRPPSGSSSPDRQTHDHGQTHVPPVLAPKPPSAARQEGLVRKTATQRPNKQMTSEGTASVAMSNGQHVVYEAVCGKAGLPAYSKLFQAQGSGHR